MKYSVKLNPLLAYLLKRKQINFVGAFMPIVGLWVGSFPVMLIILGIYSFSLNVLFGSVVWGLIYALLMLLPVAAYFCASTTSRSAVRQDYELLTLTNISDHTILWSYVAATLYRLRMLLILAIGLAPIIFMMLSIIWIGSQRRFNGGLCVTTPIGNTYCIAELIESNPTMGEKIAIALQACIILVMLATFTAGTAILMAFIGAILGFWRQNRFKVLMVASVLAFAVGLVIGIVIIPEVALQAVVQESINPFLLFLTVVLTGVPFLLAFELVRRASPLVRRPV
jgi:hypothetical protein